MTNFNIESDGEVTFIGTTDVITVLEDMFNAGRGCTTNCLNDIKYMVTSKGSMCKTPPSTLKSSYALADDHACAIEYNGTPCCCDLTCLSSKTNVLDSVPVLNFNGVEGELQIAYGLGIVLSNVKSVVVEEGFLGFNVVGNDQFRTNSNAEYLTKWMKFNPRQYINNLVRPHVEAFITDDVSRAAMANINVVNATSMYPPRPEPYQNEPSHGPHLDAVDFWNNEFLKQTKAATQAKLQLAVDRDAGEAFEVATRSHITAQAALLANRQEGQNCLFTDNRNLLAARFVNNVQDGFRPKQSQFDPLHAVQYIPGIGVYKGWYDIVEYSNINSDVNYNNYYHEYLITTQDITLDDDDSNHLTIEQRGVSSWSNGTRVSEPWLNHELKFTTCSARINEWVLTFDEDDNIDYFTSGAYTNQYICEKVMEDCTGEHQQFGSVAECVRFYDALPQEDESCQDKNTGVGYALQGNTTLCRFLHHFMTKTSSEVHCYHVGRGHEPDSRGHYRCGMYDCMAPEDNPHVHNDDHEEEVCSFEKQGESEQRIVAALPYCVESIKSMRCMDECLQALRQFGILEGVEPRNKQICQCRDSIASNPISTIIESTNIDVAEILKICGLAGSDPNDDDNNDFCDENDDAIWSAVGQSQFLNQQGACGAHCSATTTDPTQFAPCVALCVQASGTAYSTSCAPCFGGVGACVAAFCGSSCGGSSITPECEACAFSTCNEDFQMCSGWDASVPPSTDTSIDGMCGDAAAWEKCPRGQYRTQPQNVCESVQTRINDEAAVNAMQKISAFYSTRSITSTTNKTVRDTHLIDAEVARVLATLPASPYAAVSEMIAAAYNQSDTQAVPFIDGPMLVGHASVKAAMEQANQERSLKGFFWQTDMYTPDVWGEHGPTQKQSNSNAHLNARQMTMAAWPMLAHNEATHPAIEVEALPTSVTDAVKEAGGNFADLTSETLTELSSYIVEQVMKQLFPGGDFDDAFRAALATIGIMQRMVATPSRYQEISGLLGSDSLKVARDYFANWVEDYYGPVKMAELCAMRSDEGLTDSECAMDLADSAWVNGMYPMSKFVLGSLATIASDVGKQVPLFKKDSARWLLEQARITSPVDVFSFVSENPIAAEFNSVTRQYAAGEGTAIAWISLANQDPDVFQAPKQHIKDRSDSGNSVAFNFVLSDYDYANTVQSSDASLARACPAYRFSLRMADALVSKMLPDEASLNALAAGLPLKENDKYEAYTVGQLEIGGKDPIATAIRNASVALAFQEVQKIINEFDQEAQSCLFVSDIQLVSLRAGVFFGDQGDFTDQALASIEEDIVMRVPGLGVYYGDEDALEYALIMASPEFNNDYHIFLQQMYQMEFLGGDRLHLLAHMVSAWENFTRVSTPIYDNYYNYSPCSARIREWNLTFEELPSGVNPTFDYFVGGAYTNERLCQEVMNDCTGEHQQFGSVVECVKFYESLPKYDQACLDRDNGIDYALQGNTTLCRFLHHFMMHSSPELHCYHVGRGDRPDAHGHFKCVPEDCSPPVISQEQIENENNCVDELQADIEMRLASVLPHCLGALRSGKCRDSDEDERDCPRALRQFGFAGDAPNARKRSLQAAKCKDKIKLNTLSATLQITEIDAMDLLRVCAAKINNTEATDLLGEFRPCPRFDGPGNYRDTLGYCRSVKTDIVQKAPEIIRSISRHYGPGERRELSTPSGVNTTLLKDVHLVDSEAARAIADLADSGTNNSYLPVTTFGNPYEDVPFVGGSIVMDHAKALAVIKDEAQLRDGDSFNRQPGQFNSPIVGSPYGSVMSSSGTVDYLNAKRMMSKAWPMLTNRTDIVLPELPKSFTDKLKEGRLNNLEESLSQDMALWFIEANLAHLHPNHQGITDKLKLSLLTFVGLGWQLCSPTAFHKISGNVGADGINLARLLLAEWLEEYYGEEHMTELTRIRNGGDVEHVLTEREASLALVDVLWTNVFAAVGRTVSGIATRMNDDPCVEIDLFKSDPKSYIIEHVRMDPPVEMMSFINSAGEQSSISLTGVNRDPRVFKYPHKFNPSRADLNKSLSWNALGEDIALGKGPSMTRVCPAHEFSILMTEALVKEMLPSEEDMPIICHVLWHATLFYFLMMTVNGLGAFVALAYIYMGVHTFILRHKLRDICEEEIERFEMEKGAVARSDGEPPPRPMKRLTLHKLKSATSFGAADSRASAGRRDRATSGYALAMSENAASLELKDVEATVSRLGREGTRVLMNSVNVSFNAGQLTAIMGGSGAGKSTLLNVASMRQAAGIKLSGSVVFGGKRIHTKEAMAEYARAVGFVPQDLGLVVDEELSCAENLYFQGHMRWNKKNSKVQELKAVGLADGSTGQAEILALTVTSLLEKFGLLMHATTLAKDLSGGQRRRLAIALECLRPAPIMFLDEPTTGQDSTSALAIVKLLQDLARGDDVIKPKTVVMVIHQPREEIFDLVDRVVLLATGNVVYNGPTKNALEQLSLDGTGQTWVKTRATTSGGTGGVKGGNLADQMIDLLVSLPEQSVLKASGLVREREHKKSQESKDERNVLNTMFSESTLGGSNVGVGGGRQMMAPLRHRVFALLLKRHWGTHKKELVMKLIMLPVLPWTICALPNFVKGGRPEPQELIVQVLLSWMGPIACIIGSFYMDLPNWIRFLRWQQHSCVLHGNEAMIDGLLGYLGQSTLFVVPVTVLCLNTGFWQIMDWWKTIEVVAFMVATNFFTTLTIVVGMGMGSSDLGTFKDEIDKLHVVRFFSLMYLSFGSTFGGLLYGINKIPSFYSALAYTSTGFWSNTGILTVVLRNQDLPCRDLDGEEGSDNSAVDSGVGKECGVSGNVLLSAVGISDRWYLPTYGLVFLSVGTVVLGLLLYPILVRPWHKSLSMEVEDGGDEARRKRDAAGRESNIVVTEKFALKSAASSFGWSGFGKKSSNFDFDNPMAEEGSLEMKSMSPSPKQSKRVKSMLSVATISEENEQTSFGTAGSFSRSASSGPPPPVSPAPKKKGGLFAKSKSKGATKVSFIRQKSSLVENPHIWFEYVVMEGPNAGSSYFHQPSTGNTVWEKPNGEDDVVEMGN
ncbi:hypothetical protein TrST_g11425 [Triparma strigata]|nr:hypothetical protein TrST_g11425 [Triparma strigata]